jgi:HK97 family phage major capsid protein
MVGLDTTTTAAAGKARGRTTRNPGLIPMNLDDDLAREIEREVKAIGTHARASSLEQKKYTDAMADGVRDELRRELRARMDGLERKQAKEVEAIECVIRRGGMTAENGQDGMTMIDRTSPETKALERYIRRGKEALEPHEVKALTVANDSSGGMLVPPALAAGVIRSLREYNPVRQVARGATTGSDKLDFPSVSAASAYWVGEVETRQPTTVSFGGVEIELRELACYVDVSNRLLEDAQVDIFDLLSTLLGEAFAAAEGSSFLTGDGVKRPRGLLTYLTSGAIPVVPSGKADGFTNGDSLIDAELALLTPYAENGTFLMNRKTLAAVRKLKDGGGQYLWTTAPGLVADRPGVIIGRNYMIAPDMPDIAAGAVPIVFGDWRGYCVLDKLNGGMSILRDPYTLATQGLVRFHARHRTGGDLLQAERFVGVQISAS